MEDEDVFHLPLFVSMLHVGAWGAPRPEKDDVIPAGSDTKCPALFSWLACRSGARPFFLESFMGAVPDTARPVAPGVPTVRECAIRASLLLKALRSNDSARAAAAAERFRVLPHFAALTPERLVAWSNDIRRKHALNVIAVECGYPSWAALRTAAPMPRTAHVESLFDAPRSAFYLSQWCRTYEDARAVLGAEGGFLFPYRTQFVVCAGGLLAEHGIDALDPDWDLIDHDWVKPADPAAFARLNAKLVACGL